MEVNLQRSTYCSDAAEISKRGVEGENKKSL